MSGGRIWLAFALADLVTGVWLSSKPDIISDCNRGGLEFESLILLASACF